MLKSAFIALLFFSATPIALSESITTALHMDLTSVNLPSIITSRKQLFDRLNIEKSSLKKIAGNITKETAAAIERIDHRLNRIVLLEDVIRKSLVIFSQIVNSKNMELDSALELEHVNLIQELQKVPFD